MLKPFTNASSKISLDLSCILAGWGICFVIEIASSYLAENTMSGLGSFIPVAARCHKVLYAAS